MKPIREKQISRWQASSDYENARTSSHTTTSCNKPSPTVSLVDPAPSSLDTETIRMQTSSNEFEPSETRCKTQESNYFPRLPVRKSMDSPLCNEACRREPLVGETSKRDAVPTYVRRSASPPVSPMSRSPIVVDMLPAIPRRDAKEYTGSSIAAVPIWSLQGSAVDTRGSMKKNSGGRVAY